VDGSAIDPARSAELLVVEFGEVLAVPVKGKVGAALAELLATVLAGHGVGHSDRPPSVARGAPVSKA
jgi:hypothetical protein